MKRGTPRGRALVVCVAMLGGCTAAPPPLAPTAAQVRELCDVAVRAALVEADPSVTLDRLAITAAAWDRDAPRPAGIAASLAFLRAAASDDRAARIAACDALADGGADPILARQATHMLERDDLWLATRVERDAVYSRFAAVFNGVMQTAAAALQGNPVGVAQPLLAGVDTLVRGDLAEPLDRKRIALYRRFVRRHGDTGAMPTDLEELRDEVAELLDQSFAQELRLAELLLQAGKLDLALAQVRAARVHHPRDARAAALERSIAGAVDRRRERLERSLAMTVEVTPAERAALRALLVEDPPVANERESPAGSVEPWAAVARARADQRARVTRFIFTGARPSEDPLQRRAEVREDLRRSLEDVLLVLLWVPATLFRAVYAGLGDPVDDQPVVAALAEYAFFCAEDRHRDEARLELIERYTDRGETRKALAVARAAAAPAATVEALEQRLRDEQAEAPPSVDPDLVPISALGDLGEALGLLDPRIDPPRVKVGVDRLTVAVRGEQGVTTRAIEVPPEQRERLRLLLAEWQWRRRVMNATTYREQHAGVPVELRAGLGVSGLSLLPALLPERYQGRDRAQYE